MATLLGNALKEYNTYIQPRWITSEKLTSVINDIDNCSFTNHVKVDLTFSREHYPKSKKEAMKMLYGFLISFANRYDGHLVPYVGYEEEHYDELYNLVRRHFHLILLSDFQLSRLKILEMWKYGEPIKQTVKTFEMGRGGIVYALNKHQPQRLKIVCGCADHRSKKGRPNCEYARNPQIIKIRERLR